MITITTMKKIRERWKKGMRPLKVHDAKSGHKVVGMLEKYDGSEFEMFDDPLEATTFLLLVGMLKEQDLNNRWPVGPEQVLPGPERDRK
ncbi:MAG: hypothetical protein NTV68_01880 [Methanomicrobiales archaeon]|nr:hypothetical protein [Methanomicrobiales archaeon]